VPCQPRQRLFRACFACWHCCMLDGWYACSSTNPSCCWSLWAHHKPQHNRRMDLAGIAVVNWLRVSSPRTEVCQQVPLTTRSKATTLPVVPQHCHTNILAAGAVHIAAELGSTAWHHQPTGVAAWLAAGCTAAAVAHLIPWAGWLRQLQCTQLNHSYGHYSHHSCTAPHCTQW
jgi:hypothetical protein